MSLEHKIPAMMTTTSSPAPVTAARKKNAHSLTGSCLANGHSDVQTAANGGTHHSNGFPGPSMNGATPSMNGTVPSVNGTVVEAV